MQGRELVSRLNKSLCEEVSEKIQQKSVMKNLLYCHCLLVVPVVNLL